MDVSLSSSHAYLFLKYIVLDSSCFVFWHDFGMVTAIRFCHIHRSAVCNCGYACTECKTITQHLLVLLVVGNWQTKWLIMLWYHFVSLYDVITELIKKVMYCCPDISTNACWKVMLNLNYIRVIKHLEPNTDVQNINTIVYIFFNEEDYTPNFIRNLHLWQMNAVVTRSTLWKNKKHWSYVANYTTCNIYIETIRLYEMTTKLNH